MLEEKLAEMLKNVLRSLVGFRSEGLSQSSSDRANNGATEARTHLGDRTTDWRSKRWRPFALSFIYENVYCVYETFKRNLSLNHIISAY